MSRGHWDVAITLVNMSKFRVEPQKGRMDQVRQIVSLFCTGIPDYSGIPIPEYEMETSV